MKYKVGDKVKIKTWKEMEQEYEVIIYGRQKNSRYIQPKKEFVTSNTFCFRKGREKKLNKKFPDRIVKIRYIGKENYDNYNNREYYGIEGMLIWCWEDWMIECLAKDYVKPIPIETRFEILDL